MTDRDSAAALQGATPLHIAAQLGYKQVAAALLKHGAPTHFAKNTSCKVRPLRPCLMPHLPPQCKRVQNCSSVINYMSALAATLHHTHNKMAQKYSAHNTDASTIANKIKMQQPCIRGF